MSTTYSPSASWTAAITIPEDGDDADAAAWNPAVQELADNIAFLKLPATSATTPYPLKRRTITRFVCMPSRPSAYAANISDGAGSIQFAVALADHCEYQADLPDRAEGAAGPAGKLRVHAFIAPAAHTSLPAYPPAIDFDIYDKEGASVQHATQVDETGTGGGETVADYNAPHAMTTLELTLAAAIDRDTTYCVVSIHNEHGSDAKNGLVVHLPRVTFDVLTQDPGAG